jgi:hypothetical protein
VKYWHANKVGADFVTLDIKNHNRCEDPNTSDCDVEVSSDPYERMGKYEAVADWVKANIKKPDGSNYPLWWAEWYARKNPIIQDTAVNDSRWRDPSNKGYQGTIPERNAIMSAGLIKVVKSEVRTALIWGMHGVNTSGEYHPLALFNSTSQPTGVYTTQKCIKDHFSQNAKLYDPRNTNNNIEVLATDGTAGKWLLMANKTNSPQTTTAFGTAFTGATDFDPYEVKCVQP